MARRARRAQFEDWRARAACRDYPDPGIFFAETEADEAAAKAICAGCPVRETCGEANLHERDGVFGGMNGEERRRIARRASR